MIPDSLALPDGPGPKRAATSVVPVEIGTSSAPESDEGWHNEEAGMGEEEEAMVSIVALERMKRKPETGEKYRFLVPTICREWSSRPKCNTKDTNYLLQQISNWK
jgi:hypothetical protein